MRYPVLKPFGRYMVHHVAADFIQVLPAQVLVQLPEVVHVALMGRLVTRLPAPAHHGFLPTATGFFAQFGHTPELGLQAIVILLRLFQVFRFSASVEFRVGTDHG